MERLTTRECGELLIKYNDEEYRSPCFGCESINECDAEKVTCGFYKALEKLAEYEDAEEQKKLLKLHCAVGDTVYTLNTLPSGKTVIGETIADAFICALGMLEGRFGKTMFLTMEAAEAALKEMNEVTPCEENVTPACAEHA